MTYGNDTGQPEGDPVSLQTGSVCELDVSADGGTLAVADCNEPTVALFSLDGHATIAPIIASGEGLGGYSADGRLLWTRSAAGIVIRDARTFERLHRMPDFPFAMFTRDGDAMFVVQPDGRAGAYDYRAGRFVDRAGGAGRPRPTPTWGPGPSTRRPGTSPWASPKARSSSSTSRVGPPGRPSTSMWMTSTPRCTGCRSRPTGGASPSPPRTRRPSSTTRRRASRSARRSRAPATPGSAPTARCSSAAAFNGTLAFYDGETLEPSGPPVTGSRSWASSLAFSDDGRQLATVALDSSARLYDVEAREQIGTAFDAGDRHGGRPATRRARARPRPTGRTCGPARWRGTSTPRCGARRRASRPAAT